MSLNIPYNVIVAAVIMNLLVLGFQTRFEKLVCRGVFLLHLERVEACQRSGLSALRRTLAMRLQNGIYAKRR